MLRSMVIRFRTAVPSQSAHTSSTINAYPHTHARDPSTTQTTTLRHTTPSVRHQRTPLRDKLGLKRRRIFLANIVLTADLLSLSKLGVFRHSTHRHVGPHIAEEEKHWQYSLRHFDFLQVHPCGWGCILAGGGCNDSGRSFDVVGVWK
jgi:hypothetical protein